jgi:hypothetical protein
VGGTWEARFSARRGRWFAWTERVQSSPVQRILRDHLETQSAGHVVVPSCLSRLLNHTRSRADYLTNHTSSEEQLATFARCPKRKQNRGLPVIGKVPKERREKVDEESR